MCYFTWKLELVSNILWMVVGELSFELWKYDTSRVYWLGKYYVNKMGQTIRELFGKILQWNVCHKKCENVARFFATSGSCYWQNTMFKMMSFYITFGRSNQDLLKNLIVIFFLREVGCQSFCWKFKKTG